MYGDEVNTPCQPSTIYGMTGTRLGLTTAQAEAFSQALAGATELHHGCCVGADADAHAIARLLGVRVVAHPPLSRALRAECEADEVRRPEPYMVRNRHIVEDVQRLIGCPDGPARLRSGSWATIRMALRAGKPVLVIYPDGTREEHAWS
jgi:hypothetical protein